MLKTVKGATETKLSYPFLFPQSIDSNVVVIQVNFNFAKSQRKVLH